MNNQPDDPGAVAQPAYLTEQRIDSKRRSRALDWTCASMILVWGIMLLLPGNGLAQSSGYAGLYERFPEIVWAIAFCVIGIGRILALIVNGHMPSGSPAIRGLAAFLGVIVWGYSFAGFLELSIRIGNLMLPTGFFLVLLAADIFTFSRAAADYRRAQNGDLLGN